MKKVFGVLFLAIMIAFASPSLTWAGSADQGQSGQSGQSGQAGQDDQTPPADNGDEGQSDQTPPADTGDEGQSDDEGQSGQSGQSGQAGQAGQDNGGTAKFCLWAKIKALFAKDPAKEHEKMLKLLDIANKDLELCLNTISGKKVSYFKVFPAVEHLNHALSALNKVKAPKTLKPAFKELKKRISHAKFCLVAYDLDEATARIEKAQEVIGSIE